MLRKLSTQLNIVSTFENSTKKPLVFLALIVLAGLFLRLVYFPYDIPIVADGQGYFWYAIDMSVLNQLPTEYPVHNTGWPSFLSIIFQFMDSNHFLDYHNVQRIVGVVFSLATIFPVYFLCSRYFKKSYSLLGATLFVFEPKLVQNSLLGTPESMYVFLMATLLFLFLSNNFNRIYLAFGIIGLLALVRFEGLLMIIPISIVFFIRFRKQKKDLIKYIVCISIFVLILMPMAYLNNERTEQDVSLSGLNIPTDGFISHIAAGTDYYVTTPQSGSTTVFDLLYLGGINLVKYVGWSQIPSFIIFIPLGIILIFKRLDYKKITIILSILIMLIPAFYGYSRGFQELKYLFVLYPIFCILACFTFKIFLEKFNRKNLIFCMIIGGIIVSSVIFIEWKSIDYEHEGEEFQIMMDISKFDMKVNMEIGKEGGANSPIGYLHWAKIYGNDEFPNLKESFSAVKPLGVYLSQKWAEPISLEETEINLPSAKNSENTKINYKMIKSIIQYVSVAKENQLTHLLVDNYNNSDGGIIKIEKELRYIFSNEKEFPFLKKVYDSKEEGYNYHVKLFKINYEEFKEYLESNL